MFGNGIANTARFTGFHGLFPYMHLLCTKVLYAVSLRTTDSQAKFTLKTTLNTKTVIGPLAPADHLQAANQGIGQRTFTRNGDDGLTVWRVFLELYSVHVYVSC